MPTDDPKDAAGSAPLELKLGVRVWLNEDVEQHNRIVVGTVVKISRAGYVRVAWDEPNVYPESYFSPLTAASQLKVVSGDDAIQRHDWDCQKDQTDPPCLRCGVIQTDENELGPCKPRSPAVASPAPRDILLRHRRHVELSPGVGKDAQQYALAVCDDILADLPAAASPALPTLLEKLKALRIKFDALLIREIDVFGGVPSYAGRTGQEQTELRDAIAEVLAVEAALASSGVGIGPSEEKEKCETRSLDGAGRSSAAGLGLGEVPRGRNTTSGTEASSVNAPKVVAGSEPAESQPKSGVGIGSPRPAEWQPIETAPKNGGLIVYAANSGDFMVMDGRMLVLSRRPDVPRHLSGRHWTHWMPLPVAPRPAEQEK